MLLRYALAVDGVISGLCGVVAILAARPLADLLGVPAPAVLVVVGAGLLVYAAGLILGARRPRVSPALSRAAVALNGAWVLGSVAVIEAGLLTAIGNWIVAGVAMVVLAFAAFQYGGLRQARRVG